MAVDPQVYDDKLLEIINSLQIPPSLEEQLSIGATDLLAPSWNLPGGPEGGIYPLMPGMEYAPTMATAPIIAPPKGGPEPPPEVVTDPGPSDPGPISSAPSDGIPPAAGGTGPPSIPGYNWDEGFWTPELMDKVLAGEIDLTDPGFQHHVPPGTGPGAIGNLLNWMRNRRGGSDIELPELTPDFSNILDDVEGSIPDFSTDRESLDALIDDLAANGLNVPDDLFEGVDEADWKTKLGDWLGKTSGLPPGLGGEFLGNLVTSGLGGIQNLLGAIPGIGDLFGPEGGIANLLDRGGDFLGNIRGGIGNLLGLGNLPFFGGSGRGIGGFLRDLFDREEDKPEPETDVSLAVGGIAGYPRVNALIEGPGTEKSDDIKAMLSDGEFVTNAAALRGIGRLNGADPKDKAEQRRIGAREMYRLQRAGEKAAGVTT